MIKSIVTCFVGTGMFFALYATLSCRWFVVNVTLSGVEKWQSLPLDGNNGTATASIGIFRYHESLNISDGSFFSSDINGQCVQYDPLFSDDKWKLTAQVCVILGPVLALVAFIVAMIDVNRNAFLSFILAATFVQSVSVIASMSMCDRYSNCPWLMGTLTNIFAACSFLVSFLIAICGLVPKTEDRPTKVVQDVEAQENDSLPEEDRVSSTSLGFPAPFDTETDRKEQKDKTESAEDLLGTDDPIIHKAVRANALVVKQLKYAVKTRRADPENDNNIPGPSIAVTGSKRAAEMDP